MKKKGDFVSVSKIVFGAGRHSICVYHHLAMLCSSAITMKSFPLSRQGTVALVYPRQQCSLNIAKIMRSWDA